MAYNQVPVDAPPPPQEPIPSAIKRCQKCAGLLRKGMNYDLECTRCGREWERYLEYNPYVKKWSLDGTGWDYKWRSHFEASPRILTEKEFIEIQRDLAKLSEVRQEVNELNLQYIWWVFITFNETQKQKKKRKEIEKWTEDQAKAVSEYKEEKKRA